MNHTTLYMYIMAPLPLTSLWRHNWRHFEGLGTMHLTVKEKKPFQYSETKTLFKIMNIENYVKKHYRNNSTEYDRNVL